MQPNVALAKTPKPRMLVKVFVESNDTVVLTEGIEHRFTLNRTYTYLHFSDGTILYVWKDAEAAQCWKIIPHTVAKAKTERREGISTDEETVSDIIRLTGNIKWVALWDDAKPGTDELQDQLEEFRWRNVDNYEKLMALWKLANDLT